MRRAELMAALLVVTSAACVTTQSMFRTSNELARERTGFDSTYRRANDESSDAARDIGELDASVARLLSEPLGPNEAIRIGLARSPALQVAFEQLGVARADLLTASIPPNVEFDLEARLGRAGSQAGDEVEAHVVIDVTDLMTLPLRRAAAMAEVESSQFDAAEAVLQVAFDVRSAFVAHVAAIRLELAMRDVVRTTRAASEFASALYDAGNVARLDAVSHQALYEESRLWLAEAELEVLESRERLITAMGLSGDELRFEVAMRLDDPAPNEANMDRLEARAIDRNLHLAAARSGMDAIARRANVARIDGALPSLRAGVSGSLADGRTAFGPAVSLSVPLWNQGQGPTRRLEAEWRIALRRFESDAIAVRSNVRRARNRLVSARERALFLRDNLLPLRARVVEETVLQYNAMQSTPFQVLEARREEVTTIRDYVRTLKEYWVARSALVHVLAGGRVDFDASAEESP